VNPPKKLRPWPQTESEKSAGESAELAAWEQLVEALAEGEAGVLRRVAGGARESSGAVFVAIARGAAGGRGVSFAAVDGPAGTEAALGHKALVPIWRAALEERRVISGEVPAGREGRIPFAREPLESVLAIPLEARGVALGLLVAGFREEEPGAAARERLEQWTPLAALALVEERRAGHARVQDQWLAALLDSMENAVLLLAPDGRVQLANARLPALLGIDPGRMARIKTFDELVAAVRGNFRDARSAEARWRDIQRRDDEVACDEVELERPAPRVLERFARPVRAADGERLGWLELYRETPGERLLRSRLPQTEKLAALGQLVSGVAHELNNPLTSIVGYAQLLRARAAGSERGEEARHIFEEAQRANAIVRNLLLFARRERAERRRVRLNEIVKQTLALRNYELRVSNIRLTLDLEPGLPAVLADPHQMQQLVLNLLINAEQAVESGGAKRGEIEVRTRSARSGERGRRTVRLEVSDDGAGIPRDVLPRIFDPFFTTKPAGIGTGLGLSIVQAIAREHGGEVSAESEEGRGATFVVEQPAAEIDGDEPESEATAAVVERPATIVLPVEQRRILVIEDEATVANLVADVLRDEGHEVVSLLDSVAALERLTVEDFDLVICDLKMPKLDGRGLYEEALRRGRISRDRVLFITGDTLRPRTMDFVERGGLPYLAKPFLVEELTQMVRSVLSRRAEGETLAPVPRRGQFPAGDK
jgi:signal transduction histidine kinase/ActR/RegA family two-component response regulator